MKKGFFMNTIQKMIIVLGCGVAAMAASASAMAINRYFVNRTDCFCNSNTCTPTEGIEGLGVVRLGSTPGEQVYLWDKNSRHGSKPYDLNNPKLLLTSGTHGGLTCSKSSPCIEMKYGSQVIYANVDLSSTGYTNLAYDRNGTDVGIMLSAPYSKPIANTPCPAILPN